MRMRRHEFENITLESAEDKCQEVYGTQHGHNIISLICNQVKEKFGKAEADRLFEEYQS